MGFELGPGVLRRAPRGWLPARAFALRHSVYSHGYGADGAPEIETTMGMRVLWRVQPAGRPPYELDEERTVPAWLATGGLAASGKRWYKVRVRPSYGLMRRVGVPCFVNPADPSQLWVDWDAAYEEHVPAWEQEARVRLEVARRTDKVEGVVERVTNPFAGRLQPGDEPIVEERIAAQAQRAEAEHAQAQARMAAMGFGAVSSDESAEHKRRSDELTRIHATGARMRGTVVAREETGRTLANIPVTLLTFEIEGRRVVFEHVWGPRHGKAYKVGKTFDVWVDRDDPHAICPGR